jgi:hypothetical protein
MLTILKIEKSVREQDTARETIHLKSAIFPFPQTQSTRAGSSNLSRTLSSRQSTEIVSKSPGDTSLPVYPPSYRVWNVILLGCLIFSFRKFPNSLLNTFNGTSRASSNRLIAAEETRSLLQSFLRYY